MMSPLQGLVEDVMYFSWCGITMSGGYDAYQWIYEETGLTSRSDQLVGTSACPH